MARREPSGAGRLLPTGWWALPLIVVLLWFVRYKVRHGADPWMSDLFGRLGDFGLTSLVVFLLALAVVAYLGSLLASRVRRRVPPEEMERRAEELAREWLERENERKQRAGEE